MSTLSGLFLSLTLDKSLRINEQVNCQLSYITPTCRALESEVPKEIIMIRGARKSAKYFFETVFTEDRNNTALSWLSKQRFFTDLKRRKYSLSVDL